MTEGLRAGIEGLGYNNVSHLVYFLRPNEPKGTKRPLQGDIGSCIPVRSSTNFMRCHDLPSWGATPLGSAIQRNANNHQTSYTYQTAPSPSPSSINNLDDAALSSDTTLPTILPHLSTHDAFLVACYSPHPLVRALKSHTQKPVLGIFEASVSTAISLLGNNERFGIVSTGKVWQRILGRSLRDEVLGTHKADDVFAGTETLGLDAGDLHGDRGEEEVKKKVQAAVGRFFDEEVDVSWKLGVVVLGCAGMAGMEEWVKEEVKRREREVRVVDGVKAGVGILQGLVRGGF